MGSISVTRREDPVAGALTALDSAVDTRLAVQGFGLVTALWPVVLVADRCAD